MPNNERGVRGVRTHNVQAIEQWALIETKIEAEATEGTVQLALNKENLQNH